MSSSPPGSTSVGSTGRWQALDQLRVVGASGTNKVMAGELSRLCRRALPGFRLAEPIKMGTGALVYPFDAALAHVATTYLRTCTRVYWDVLETTAPRLEPLYDDLRAGVASGLSRWVRDGMRISVETQDVRTFAAGERQVIGTVKNAIVKAAAEQGMTLRVDGTQPDAVWSVRTDEGRTRLSLDLAGRPMNQRGYRQGQALAPLREDTAAVLLMLARFDARTEVLIDPMAGSGTIAIEAACMADARPIWVPPRAPIGQHLPALHQSWLSPTPRLFSDTRAVVLANDVDPRAIEQARAGSIASQTTAAIEMRVGDFRGLTSTLVRQWMERHDANDRTGVILCNPPYGERLDDPDLPGLYRDLARWCRQFRGFRAGFLVANPDLERAFGVRPRVKKPLRNGPLRAYFLLYDL